MRTKITTDNVTGNVTIKYLDCFGDLCERTFSTTSPFDHSSVLELFDNGQTAQVCERLSSMGWSLTSTRASLPDVIRREYRRMRRAEGK
jgi:hypothetical protein